MGDILRARLAQKDGAARGDGARPRGMSLVSAVDAAGVRPDDAASSDCRAARASAAGTVDAFGAYDGVRFGDERDAQESRQD